jgi:hypothetical protein
VLHEPELAKLLDVGHVANARLRIDRDDVAALALLDEVKDHIVPDPGEETGISTGAASDRIESLFGHLHLLIIK